MFEKCFFVVNLRDYPQTMSALTYGIRKQVRRANTYKDDALLRSEVLALQAMRPFWVNFGRLLKHRRISYLRFEGMMKDYGFPVRRESISSAVKGHFSRFSFRYLCACADVLGYSFDDLYCGRFYLPPDEGLKNNSTFSD